MPHLALGRLGPILNLGQQLGLDPDAAMRDALAVGLGLADQRCKASAKHLRARAVETVVDLARVKQILAFATASANPSMVSVSRCAHVFLAQSFDRLVGYLLSRTLETTPSRPVLQAC